MAEAAQQAAADPDGKHAVERELSAFWDWAMLELLVQSGLRVEEACELTTLDVLKRRLTDGRLYYMLHIKPSKFDRARVLPIGDSLGRVIAEMVRHIKRAYGADQRPAVRCLGPPREAALAARALPIAGQPAPRRGHDQCRPRAPRETL